MELKKVLIITYNWPPSGGINVLRCLKIAKYLREFGWEPIIYTAKDAQYPYFDYTNEKDIPAGITVLKKPILEPFGLFKKLTGRGKEIPLNNIVHVRDKQGALDKFGIWVRGNYFVPDARFLWIKPSVKYLVNFLQENPVEAIFTDGPPHTNTVIGCEVSKLTGTPWLSDFQDPWTQVDYYKLFKIGKRADAKHKKLEQETFKTAKKITIASPTWKGDLESIGAKNVDVIYYGYDEDDFKNIVPVADKKFTLCHSGLLGFDRKPENLFTALKELKEEIEGFSGNLQLKLMGQIDYTVFNLAKTLDLEDNILNLGTVSRERSLQEVCNSWILLLPLNKADNIKGRIPGKFYEYIRAERPILSFGPNDSDVAEIINEYGAGDNFEYTETCELKAYIKKQYQEYYFKKDFSPLVYKKDKSFFSNKNQTKLVAKYLDEITKK